MKIEKSPKTPKLLSKHVSFRRAKRAGNRRIKSFTWEETKRKTLLRLHGDEAEWQQESYLLKFHIYRRAAALSIDSPEIHVWNLRFSRVYLLWPPESWLGDFTHYLAGPLVHGACPWTH